MSPVARWSLVAALGLVPASTFAHSLVGPEVVYADAEGSFEYEVTLTVDPGGLDYAGAGWDGIDNILGGGHGDCFCLEGCTIAEGVHVFTVSGELTDPEEPGLARYWVAACAPPSLELFTTVNPASVSVGSVSGQPSVVLRGAPNPIVNRTTFVTDLHDDGVVALTVYDSQGREVARPFVGMRDPGRLQVTWDVAAAALEPGVYFARLDQEGRRLATCRVVVAR